ncbi:toll/interleukin-1 receptor domain-containing protein [Minwuia sp.]|uniref:toll/interleukin-1 receptor domain-containing protein n=1 Tax=Minwuia sp. TaxID=2493630 RepID=UPI003A922843
MDQDDIELGGDDAKVFLSYSRKDRDRAQRIADVLRERHFGVFKDTDDILPTEEWKGRLEQLIEEADTIVFLLSPHSAASEVCAWEVEYATSLNKRIAPIVIEEVEGKDIPPLLARLNFIFCTERDRFEDAVDSLVSALNVDIDWIREHTRLAALARRWDEAGRPARLLLRGQDIADAEQWRDTHPKDAPEVTPLQASFISESRRAAARRQRSWVFGSMGVAAATIALAVFAWFQSVEADRQRIAAEEQRTIAEQNEAEAARQRDVAEQRRQNALRSLAADRLRAGDRADGLRTLLDLDPGPSKTVVSVLSAGLTPAGDIQIGDFDGFTFMLNDSLYLYRHSDRTFVPLPGFPASRFIPLDGATALVSDTGAIRLHGHDGDLRAEAAPRRAIRPCAVNKKADGGVRLFGTYAPGYSACSIRITSTEITAAGIAEPDVGSVCEDRLFDITGWREPSVSVADMGDVCTPVYQDGVADRSGFEGALDVPRPVERIAFPQSVREGAIWQAMQPIDGIATTRRMIQRINLHRQLTKSQKELFGINQFAGAEAGWFVLPEFTVNAEISVVSGIVDWGGTGGESDLICFGPPDARMTCTSFHHFGGYNGYRVSAQGALIAFGIDLTNEDVDAPPANVWIAGDAVSPLVAVEGIGSFGEVLDADFGPDGRLALLTESTIILYRLSDDARELMIRPEGAGAIEWLSTGELAVMAETGLLHMGLPGEGFEAVRLFETSRMRPDDPEAEPHLLWLRESDSGGFLGVAVSDAFLLLDPVTRAPLTSAVRVPDPQMSHGGAGVRITVHETGEVVLNINGRAFRRRAALDDTPVAELIDPQAPLKRDQ